MLLIPSLIFCLALAGNKAPAPSGVWAAEWSLNGRYIALGGDDSTIWLYNGHDYQLIRSFKSNSMARGLSWHPAEHLLAIATMKGVQLLDVSTQTLTNIPNLQTGGRGIGWNYNGQLLALADAAGQVQIMNRQGNILRTIKKHDNNSYLALDWHPTKNILVTGGDEIMLFDTTGKQLKMIKHRKEPTGILSVKWHPSGTFFASGDYGHEKEGMPTLLQFWKEDGTPIRTIKGHREEIRNLRWSKDGSRIATAADALRIWDKNGKLLFTGSSGIDLWGIAWSPDGNFIVTASFGNGQVILWNGQAKKIREL
ncbi:MAG TPA: hypothetical protein VD996_10275 [Chitinophagaceae bacterium]|nr:hypothetical protein [Chitinophagaceae bacterium]